MAKHPLFLAIEVALARELNTLDRMQVFIATPGNDASFQPKEVTHFQP